MRACTTTLVTAKDILQVAVNLAVAEEELQFEHRDLHHGNVLLKPTTEDSLAFKFRCGSCAHAWMLLWPPKSLASNIGTALPCQPALPGHHERVPSCSALLLVPSVWRISRQPWQSRPQRLSPSNTF